MSPAVIPSLRLLRSYITLAQRHHITVVPEMRTPIVRGRIYYQTTVCVNCSLTVLAKVLYQISSASYESPVPLYGAGFEILPEIIPAVEILCILRNDPLTIIMKSRRCGFKLR